MTYTVRIPWRTGDTSEKWNETCAWTVEQFGLPGSRFTWHPTEEYMDFVFHNSRDAIYFKLKWL